ncbi:ribonuclease H-like domain-containing protein [Tanacetum coccineum]
MASPDQQWYMDTGATSHLSSHTGNLQTSSLNRNFHSVIVGNGSFIPVTHSGHLQIPNPYRPLHLKNVLVTPNIIKNLVSVRKFTTDNKCSIDFDPYGFTVRDYHTRQTLLRCDSTGDLYPLHVAASAFALLTNNHSLWHQRLGHPSDNSKLLHFRAFVKTQFNGEIKAFQCDHGGEFDNNTLHEVFTTNGIQFRFSCPRTSQQNGKSERMIHNINNVVRSLLFQARLPPEYWVEALLTAAYLLNILPSTSINNDIPYTKLFNKPNSYNYLRTFGCLCYPYTFPPHKLAPRTTPSIFLGIAKANPKYNLHVTTSSPIPKSPFYALRDPIWKEAMCENIKLSLTITHSPVVKPATIRTVLSLAVSRQWPIYQLDVKNAFLHSHLKETVYMHQPPGFTDLAHSDYGPDTAYLLLYVDDIILTASSTSLLQRIISLLHAEFAMTDLGPLNYFLGISATRTTSGIFLTLIDTEKKLGPEGSSVTDPTLYRSLARSLQYLTFTRPDLSYAVEQLCLYMHDPREPYLNATKRVLRYLRGTTDLGLQLFRSTTSQLIAYSDADWAGCPATRRSTSVYCVFLGDNLMTWSSKRQDMLSRSSAEAEYRGVANDVAETSWIRNLLRDLHTSLFTATLVYCDNVSALYMSANPVQHQRTKHIEIDIHFVRDKVAAGHV